ncbi:mitochondrial ATP synthase g subunit-domain-containing protein, partial [Fomitopsis betulina]
MRASVPFRTAQLRPRANVRVQRRFASNSPSGINTEEAQKKAQEALASAGKRLGQAVEVGKKYLGPVGEKAGNMLGSYREPLLYNFAVAREFLKQVYIAERLQPPTSLSTLQNVYSTLWSRASNPAYWRELVRSGEWTKVGIYAVEAYGVFKIGEIVGRRSLVGYKV